QVLARGQLRYHPSVLLEHADLRGDDVRQDLPAVGNDRSSSLIAGGFNAKNTHRRRFSRVSRFRMVAYGFDLPADYGLSASAPLFIEGARSFWLRSEERRVGKECRSLCES